MSDFVSQNILVAGVWHLGSVVASCIAETKATVYLWDQRDSIREKWSCGIPPIFEPGLEELAQGLWNKHLFWTTDLRSLSPKCDWIVLAYDTPINEFDEVQLTEIERGLSQILECGIAPHTNFLLTSQLPIGTSRRFQKRIAVAFPHWRGHVLYQPENLRLGSAIDSLKNPDRIALGYDTTKPDERMKLESQFRILFNLPTVPIDNLSLESAEMVKHALNSFLATCVVFGNELSEACEKSGADAWEVAASLKKDSRVGKKAPLFPGLGFAGGTLARDVKTLSSQFQGPSFFSELYQRNTLRNEWVINSLTKKLGSLRGKSILLLGVTYKPFTSTVRRSPAVDIAALLKNLGAKVRALDPMADLSELNDSERNSLPFSLDSQNSPSLAESDALVLVTEWPEFLKLDWKTIARDSKVQMVVDTKNFLKPLDEFPELLRIIPGKILPDRIGELSHE